MLLLLMSGFTHAASGASPHRRRSTPIRACTRQAQKHMTQQAAEASEPWLAALVLRAVYGSLARLHSEHSC
jgi:hypothetical protein